MTITVPIAEATTQPVNIPNGVSILGGGGYHVFGNVDLNTDGIPQATQGANLTQEYYLDYANTPPTSLALSSTGCEVGLVLWDNTSTATRINIVVRNLSVEGVVTLDITTATTTHQMQLKLVAS